MDINDFRAITTVVLMVLFIGVWLWAWSPKRKKDFTEASMLPFTDEISPKHPHPQENNHE